MKWREKRHGNRHCPPTQFHFLPQAAFRAEWAASSGGKVHLTNTGFRHLQGEGRRGPGACTGSDQSKLAWLLPQLTFLLPQCHPGKQSFPLCASAGHKNASLVIKGHLAAETLGFWSGLPLASIFLEERGEQNGQMEAQKGQRASFVGLSLFHIY